MITSGTQIKVNAYPLVPSDQLAPENWGQPPAHHYVFMTIGTKLYGQLIAGVYISSQPEITRMDRLPGYEEPEDAILLSSGILPRLIAHARQEPPSLDWEQDLRDL